MYTRDAFVHYTGINLFMINNLLRNMELFTCYKQKLIVGTAEDEG